MTAITLPRPPVGGDGPAPGGPYDTGGPASSGRRPTNPVSAGDQRWARPALVVLLVATGALYLWGLGASGWANSFYSAAVQAGTKSWKAFFFGSSDAANFITIDKPPAALWVMELTARLFGVNAWSILVPQALEGVAAVGLLYAGVRRWFGAGAGLLAGAVMALTPVAALMFRFNNPDALLVLALTAAAYAMVRALEAGKTRWLVAAATLVGFGFVTKMLQALLVVPAFALVYLVAGPPKLGRRLIQLLVAAATLALSSLWWVVAVMAVPASQRPYIGGSQNNSLWNLIFGYNGFGRLTGSESGSVGGGGGNSGRWGPTGWLRMFNSAFGGQISWLLPAALLFLLAGLVITLRSERTDRGRAALILWGGWLLVTAVVFSLGKGIIHPYYTVALAPAIGALVGVGAGMWWPRRDTWPGRAVLSSAVVVTAWWSTMLLRRSPSWHPWLRGRLGAGRGCRGRPDRCLAGPAHPLGRGGGGHHDDLRRSRRSGRLRLEHCVHGPRRSHPVGRAGGGRRVRPGGAGRTRWVRWRSRRRCRPAGLRRRAGPDRQRRWRVRPRWLRLRRRGGARRRRSELRRRWRLRWRDAGTRWGRRPSQREHAKRRPDRNSEGGQRPLHLGRGHDRFQ